MRKYVFLILLLFTFYSCEVEQISPRNDENLTVVIGDSLNALVQKLEFTAENCGDSSIEDVSSWSLSVKNNIDINHDGKNDLEIRGYFQLDYGSKGIQGTEFLWTLKPVSGNIKVIVDTVGYLGRPVFLPKTLKKGDILSSSDKTWLTFPPVIDYAPGAGYEKFYMGGFLLFTSQDYNTEKYIGFKYENDKKITLGWMKFKVSVICSDYFCMRKSSKLSFSEIGSVDFIL